MGRNVGFVIPGLKNGGAERVLSTISLNLNKDIKQYIFAWNGKEKDYDFNADIIDFDVHNSSNIIKNIFILLKRVKMLKKYKKEYKIDTCISHLEGANIVNILSKTNEKTVITVHNFQSRERKGIYGFVFRVLMKALYNKADKIVVVSKLIKEDLSKNFGINEEKIEVIYNPFDCKLIEKLAEEKIEDKYEEIFKHQVVINVGRLTKQKGQWHLIKAFSELKKVNKDVKLVILGKGELEDRLKELIKTFNLEEDVFLLGFTTNPFKYIARADIFALTSLYEGFPMCIAESMACGTPVLSVDCKSGPREMLTINSDINKEADSVEFEEYGVISPEFSEEDDTNNNISAEEKIFASAMSDLLQNNEKISQYSTNGKNRVKELDVNEIIKRWNNLL